MMNGMISGRGDTAAVGQDGHTNGTFCIICLFWCTSYVCIMNVLYGLLIHYSLQTLYNNQQIPHH
jgi:hypothetical protein